MAKRLFKKSYGASERKWNTLGLGTTRKTQCELCGKIWPALEETDDGYSLFRFLGFRGVEQCCGKVLDDLYGDVGETFSLAYLDDFTLVPMNPKFTSLRTALKEKSIPVAVAINEALYSKSAP